MEAEIAKYRRGTLANVFTFAARRKGVLPLYVEQTISETARR